MALPSSTQDRIPHEARRVPGRVSRRPPRGVASVLAVALIVGSGLACREASTVRSPADWNVVLVTLDTVRADALGAYGQPRATTPVLDRIAQEGVLFADVTSAAPHTVASHASIMTGLYPFAHGARANHGFPLAPEHTTLAEILAAAGHRTRAEIAA
ncbi:MAG: sulfatase-like hydrolase/transferase, partial [Myxococcota bacterium]